MLFSNFIMCFIAFKYKEYYTMNSVKKERQAKYNKDIGQQKKNSQNVHSRKEIKQTDKFDVNIASSALYKSGSGNIYPQKTSNSNSAYSQRTSMKVKSDIQKEHQILPKQQSTKQLTRINQQKQHNQTFKKSFVSTTNVQKKLVQTKQKCQQLTKDLQRLKNIQNQLIQARNQIKALEKQNEELKSKINKMKERAQQNKKLLRSKVNNFNQQADVIVKFQAQMQNIKQQNQDLKSQLQCLKSYISEFESKKTKQQNERSLGVSKICQHQVIQKIESQQKESKSIKAHQKQVEQGFQRLIKQISETFSNRTQQYRERIAQQQSQIQKLESIIDRYYEQNLCGQKLKVTFETDQQLLHQIQMNQKLNQQIKQVKQKVLLLQLQNQSWKQKHKDALCYLEVQKIKSRGIIIKIIESKFTDRQNQLQDYSLYKNNRYYNCKCENQQEILSSQIQRLKVQIHEAKRLGEMYFQDNRKKEQIIKMLSTPRKTTIHK